MTSPPPPARTPRVAFFGTPEFACPTLHALLSAPIELVAVVTQPDRPSGRGQRLTAPPAKRLARAHGIPVFQPDRLRDAAFVDLLHSWALDLGVVAAYGRLLPDAVLDAPRRGLVNVHPSLLPKYRGAAPVHRAVIAGETISGVTIMRVVRALDAGPILAREERGIGPEETSDEVERALAELGAALLARVLSAVLDGRIREEPQNDALATYAPRLTKQEGAIDWTAPAWRIHHLVRGLHPWPLAYTSVGGRRLAILRTHPPTAEDLREPGAEPGTVVAAAGDELHVACGDGRVRVAQLQLQGRRVMTTREFLAGHRLNAGIVLTPDG